MTIIRSKNESKFRMGAAVSHFRRSVINFNAEQRALKYVEKAQKTHKTDPSPRYPSEKPHIDNVVQDPKIKEMLEVKIPQLDKNLREITITSTDPPIQEQDHMQRQSRLPTKEQEYLNHHYERPKFGFQEIPPQKIKDGKLSFREALALMSAKLSGEYNTVDQTELSETDTSYATKRVNPSKIDKMHRFFAPFERIGDYEIITEQKLRRKLDINRPRGSLLETYETVNAFVDRMEQRRLDARNAAVRDKAELEHERFKLEQEQLKLRQQLDHLELSLDEHSEEAKELRQKRHEWAMRGLKELGGLKSLKDADKREK